MSKRLYFDWNASAPLRAQARDAMRAAELLPGNPSSGHAEGRALAAILDGARTRLLSELDAPGAIVVWTSGATEANNLALLGAARQAKGSHPRPLFAAPVTEHEAVLNTLSQIEREGGEQQLLPVERDGSIRSDALDTALAREPLVISCMLAQNEAGNMHPVAELARRIAALRPRPLFHTDATQAVGKIPVSFRALGVDMMSISAHKFGGPRGVGALLLRKGLRLQPLQFGGGQEQGYRAGTENVVGIAGLIAALEAAHAGMGEAVPRLQQIGAALREGLRRLAQDVCFLTPEFGALPNTLALSIPGVDGRSLVVALDLAEVACSVGSACSSGATLPSRIAKAMGYGDEIAKGVLRLSWGDATTEADLKELLDRLRQVLARLRRSTDSEPRRT
ncbi:MAG: cysteine desulfurase [Planctomycetes bacterium]|nr:cysteine desulfurase [Planctomycetota bacterium]